MSDPFDTPPADYRAELAEREDIQRDLDLAHPERKYLGGLERDVEDYYEPRNFRAATPRRAAE